MQQVLGHRVGRSQRWAIRSTALLILVTMIATFCALFKGEAIAIPAFARKYNMACNNCHVAGFPKLNDFGNRFRDQGYNMNTDEDDPSNVHFGYWPVSLRTTLGYQYGAASRLAVGNPATGRSDGTTGSFGFTGLDILSFGSLTKNISYGVVYVPGLKSAGFNAGSTVSDSDLEYAFVRFNNVFDSSWFNVRVGKHELDLPFSEKRSPTLNSQFAVYHYMPGTRFGGAIGNPAGNPTYSGAHDFALGDNHLGMELMGWKDTDVTDGTFRYSLSAISTSGLNQATTGGGRNVAMYGHVTQSFGGYGFSEGHRIGALGMFGQAPSQLNPASTLAAPVSGTGQDSKTFGRVGFDGSMTALNGNVNIFGMYLYAWDSQDLFATQGITTAQTARWQGGFIEADYTVSGPHVVYYRYDWIRNVSQGDSTFDKHFGDVNAHTLAYRHHFISSKRLGVAFHVEYTHNRTSKTGAFSDDQINHVLFSGIDFAL
jgi:hypothetical protein